MRIFHGVREIAGQGIYSVLGLRANGYQAKMITWDKTKFNYPCDICLGIDNKKKHLFPWYLIKMISLFLYAVPRFDTFHFHFGYSLLPRNMDLWLLKLLHKRIVFEFHGTDLRQPSKIRELNPYYKLDAADEPWKDRRNRKIARYAQDIVIHDEELIPYLPKTNAKVHIVPLRLNAEQIKPFYPNPEAEKVVIVHSPSSRAIKGSSYVMEAVERLKQRYAIEFTLVENMRQEEALEIYKKADIIVDQLIIGTYGVFAIEAMAMGKPVISYITEQMRATFPKSCPIKSATIDNLEKVLEELVSDGELRHSLGVAGRKYALRYHDYKRVAKILYDIYSGSHEPIRGSKAFEEV